MTLIRELIDIPDQVQKGDFVLRLSEGVDRAEATLRDYVVTPELTTCFNDALKLIRDALQGNTSKATYLHGSFGSGKSHFMAVLHLMLQGNVAAKGIPELAPVISEHNDWIAGKKFLLVPYHMIGARDMETGILGGYVDFVRRSHPDADIPPVYVSAAIIQEAKAERESYGDEAFFARLNRSTGTGGWGDLESNWDAASFDAAVAAPPDSEPHQRLVTTLLKTVASAAPELAAAGGGFISLDKGLSVLSKHAANLGYDGVILFLDELILWLASRAADVQFVHEECAKLAKLVEAQLADRPVPLVSFVARQRDLRQLIGDNVPGAERLNFSEALGWQEGRFHTITLEDRNLPAIAEKRVLRCKSRAARNELNAAFDKTATIRDSVMNVLLTSDSDREDFRKVYPFSPALVQTLIAVSSVLQRERTALKVMMQLLVDQRDTLTVGDLVPVGDLFDVIAHGDEAFSPEMAKHFENARRLYRDKLLPLLQSQHGKREDLEQKPYDDPQRRAFRNDDRLVKTLLLAALVPEVESLRGLNAERLAALNHGTIKTPIAGREGREVLRRCKTWAASVGEIRIGEDDNPTISVQLSGVDTETIIEQARSIDNQGNRIRRVREMLFEQLGIEDRNEFFIHHEFLWRNTRRSCDILFRNIRELPDSSLENDGDDWKLIIDYPFDEPGHGPRDDLGRIQQFKRDQQGAKTICWVPTFLSDQAKKDLGLLVILEHILSGERFAQYARDLSPADRQAAKGVLENQRSALQQRVLRDLEAAYGLDAQGSLDPTHELELSERFESLTLGFEPQPPAAANLGAAMEGLLGQGLAHVFPAAPDFETEIKTNQVKKVYEQVSEATRTPDGRVPIDRPLRALLRHIADPLKLGEMGHDATHFVLGQHWKTHFTRKASEAGGEMDVRRLRQWIDDPKPMGLPKDAQNLVILIFAEQTNRSFTLHGGAFEADLKNLPDDCILVEQRLPDATDWKVAVELAGSIFGVAASPLLNAGNVAKLVDGVQARASEAHAACRSYAQRLESNLKRFGVDAISADRMKTAGTTLALVERVRTGSKDAVVADLAAAEVATSETAMGRCISKAPALDGQLESANWDIFEGIMQLTGEGQEAAATVRREIIEALTSDEHAVPLAPALTEAGSSAVRLLTQAAAGGTSPTHDAGKDPPDARTGGSGNATTATARVIASGQKFAATRSEAEAELERIREAERPNSKTKIDITWRVEEDEQAP